WYTVVRNVSSAHVGLATTFQPVDDPSDCLLLTGLVLGRFSSHASFREAPFYAKDGVTVLGKIAHAGAFVEFPGCVGKFYNHSSAFRSTLGADEQREHISQFSQAVQKHDFQSCACSSQIRQRPLEPIYSVANGKLPPHCTDGDWLVVLDGAAAPAILRPIHSPNPSRSSLQKHQCQFPSSSAFTFVGAMKNAFHMGENDYVELMGVSTDALVTYMDRKGTAWVQS
ncbi:hypothetical protein MMC30_008054, partial [Trapelia coarctata]|nr:hypothetical protein [Trapelia coarctata]